MKNFEVKNWMLWLAVVVCTIACMILLMAEPVSEGNYKEWMTVFITMKFAGIVCGAVALGCAGKLRDKNDGNMIAK